jgi:hypothetical protein
MITTAELITIANRVKAEGAAGINPATRVFVARLLGLVRDKDGQEAHDLLAHALGMDHMVGNNPALWEHIRKAPESHPLIARAEDWKAKVSAAATTTSPAKH